LLSIKELKNLLFISLFRPFPVKAFSKKEKKKANGRARHAAKRKRNNWRGPFGEAAVYAVVFLHTIGNHQATVPNLASFFSFFWKQ
jgi:hypothetical protein